MLPYKRAFPHIAKTKKTFLPYIGTRIDKYILLIPVFFLVTTLFLMIMSLFLALDAKGILLHEKRFFNAVVVSVTSATLASSIALFTALPYAYLLSRRLRNLDRLLETLGIFFLGFPPIGVGMVILVFLTENPFGRWLEEYIGILFTFKGLVVAQFFVVFPIVLKLVKEVIDIVPRDHEDILSLYGVPRHVIFFRVTIPLAKNGIMASWVVGWLRSVGEFGASIVVAGLAAGESETLTIYLYNLLASYNMDGAVFLLAFFTLMVMAFSILVTYLFRRI